MNQEYVETKRLRTPGLIISLCFLMLILSVTVLPTPELSVYEKIIFLGGMVIYITAMMWFLKSFVLSISMNDQGIRFRYPPLLKKEKNISWSDVREASAVKFEPMKSFRGWGIGKKNKRLGTSYTTDGNLGLYLRLESGENILLGIKDINQLKEALKKYAPGNKFVQAETEILK